MKPWKSYLLLLSWSLLDLEFSVWDNSCLSEWIISLALQFLHAMKHVLSYQEKVPWLSVTVCTKGDGIVLPYWKKVVCHALNGLYGSGENMRTDTQRQNVWVWYVPKILQLQEKVAYIQFTWFPGSVYLACCNRMRYSFCLWKIVYKVSEEAVMKIILNTRMIAPFWAWLWGGRKMRVEGRCGFVFVPCVVWSMEQVQSIHLTCKTSYLNVVWFSELAQCIARSTCAVS